MPVPPLSSSLVKSGVKDPRIDLTRNSTAVLLDVNVHVRSSVVKIGTSDIPFSRFAFNLATFQDSIKGIAKQIKDDLLEFVGKAMHQRITIILATHLHQDVIIFELGIKEAYRG